MWKVGRVLLLLMLGVSESEEVGVLLHLIDTSDIFFRMAVDVVAVE